MTDISKEVVERLAMVFDKKAEKHSGGTVACSFDKVVSDTLRAQATRIAELVEALRECEAEIDQSIWQEYPLDHPTHERYRQRDFDANPARIALAKTKEPRP